MSRQVVNEVTHPYHPDGKNLVHAPGDQFPLDADLPDGLVVREVIAEVPDKPKPAAKAPEGKSAGR
jgi:hypothetical protein